MEQKKHGRGRPKIDTHITETYASSRRQAVNAVYMYEGVELISVAATEIPDSDLLWCSDASTQTAGGKQGILEQLGRMLIQDKFSQDDCITIASFAIQALKAGHTTREIEKVIRKIRFANKKPLPIQKMRHSTMRRSMRWTSCGRWETQAIRACKGLAALPA